MIVISLVLASNIVLDEANLVVHGPSATYQAMLGKIHSACEQADRTGVPTTEGELLRPGRNL